jgi:tetratricopeptide (TPR) repeat protein
LSVPDIGRRLGVAKLVEGSVLIEGDRVRVIVQLIDAATDLHLWAETYERRIADIIGLQNEIARTIAEVIQARVTPVEAAELARAEPFRPDVYREYLKGMYQFRQESTEADRRGVEMLEAVVAQAPELALAHAGVAYGYAHIAHSPFPGDAYPKARAAADEALRLDPGLAQAHLAVGMYRLYYEWDVDGAEAALERAVELNPSLTEAHYHLAWLYEVLGPEREKASLAHGERTRALDPLSPFMLGWLAVQYRDACRFEEALVIAREAIRVAPEFPIGWLALGEIYAELGEFDEAIEAHGHLADQPAWAWEIATSYAAAGLEERALEIARELEPGGAPPWPLALIYTRLGDAEAALHWVAQAEVSRLPWYPWLLGGLPARETIADDPGLQARAAALGLPDPRVMGCGR